MTRFNYIVTTHNKEDILERTLKGVETCCSASSVIYPVLDGCTDRSEEIVKAFAGTSTRQVVITHTPDVHEIKSINAALKQIKEGFTVCLQDDVVLNEPLLEKKVESLYRAEGAQLGVISFCRAADLRRAGFIHQVTRSGLVPLVEECDLVHAKHDHCQAGVAVEYEQLTYRMVAIKSPVCIPNVVLKEVGLLDEYMAPYGYDDHEYCMRCMKAGFRNALFPLHFVSELEWGGTRKDKTFSSQAAGIRLRNRRYIWQKHGQFITEYRRASRQQEGK